MSLFLFPLCVFIVCDCEKCWAKCLKYVWSKEMSPRTWKQWGCHSNQSIPSIMPCWPGMSQPGYLSFCRPRTHWTRYKIYYYSASQSLGNVYLVPCYLSFYHLGLHLNSVFFNFFFKSLRSGKKQQNFNLCILLLIFFLFVKLCRFWLPRFFLCWHKKSRSGCFIFIGCVCSSKLRMPLRLKWAGWL